MYKRIIFIYGRTYVYSYTDKVFFSYSKHSTYVKPAYLTTHSN